MSDGNMDPSPVAIENMEGIFRAYYPRLCYFAFTMLDNKEMAEDMVQDVFLRLQGRLKDFFAENALKSFLYLSVNFEHMELGFGNGGRCRKRKSTSIT